MCSNELFDMLALWNHKRFPSNAFINGCRELADSLLSYSEYLQKVQERMDESRSALEPPRSVDQSFTLSGAIEKVPRVREEFSYVNDAISPLYDYSPLLIDNHQ